MTAILHYLPHMMLAAVLTYAASIPFAMSHADTQATAMCSAWLVCAAVSLSRRS